MVLERQVLFEGFELATDGAPSVGDRMHDKSLYQFRSFFKVLSKLYAILLITDPCRLFFFMNKFLPAQMQT